MSLPDANPKVVAIVQARMGSTRLPGKVLMDLGGHSVLARVVRRLSRATLVSELVVATTDSPADSPIARESERLHVPCFRGSETDVLDRYHRAALASDAGIIVRVTSDCPLIDPGLVDDTVRTLLQAGADYASNVSPRTYPRGLDTEVFTAAALRRAWIGARQPHQREHVTPYFTEHPQMFQIVHASGPADYSQHRWTLDTADDLELLRSLYSRLGNRDNFHWRDALAVLEREPGLAQLNAHVVQKSIHAH